MKHITDYSHSKEFQQPQETRFSEEDQRMITWIWAKLAARYDTKFTRKIEDPRINKIMQAEWVDKLQKYDKREVCKTVDGWMENWPPSLPEIVERLKVKDMHKRYRYLPKPRCDSKKAGRYLREIKERLR